MGKEVNEFNRISILLCSQDDVILGKMMSSPSLKYNAKVFTFLHKEKMVFKLESSKILDDMGITYELLNPFKTKPPLKGWFVIEAVFLEHWEMLSKEALELIKLKMNI